MTAALLPRPEWPLWKALTGAGLRVTNDLRRISPPVVLLLPVTVTPAGACTLEVEVEATAIAPGPEHADAQQWLWDQAAPALIAYGAATVESRVWQDYPAAAGIVTVTVAVTE